MIACSLSFVGYLQDIGGLVYPGIHDRATSVRQIAWVMGKKDHGRQGGLKVTLFASRGFKDILDPWANCYLKDPSPKYCIHGGITGAPSRRHGGNPKSFENASTLQGYFTEICFPSRPFQRSFKGTFLSSKSQILRRNISFKEISDPLPKSALSGRILGQNATRTTLCRNFISIKCDLKIFQGRFKDTSDPSRDHQQNISLKKIPNPPPKRLLVDIPELSRSRIP